MKRSQSFTSSNLKTNMRKRFKKNYFDQYDNIVEWYYSFEDSKVRHPTFTSTKEYDLFKECDIIRRKYHKDKLSVEELYFFNGIDGWSWDLFHFTDVKGWYNKYNTHPSQTSDDIDERRFAIYINHIRSDYWKDVLLQKEVEKYEKIELWSWDEYLDNNIDEKLDILKEWYKENPYHPLNHFDEYEREVYNIRQAIIGKHNKGKISHSEIVELNNISGWSWNTFTEKKKKQKVKKTEENYIDEFILDKFMVSVSFTSFILFLSYLL